MTPEWQAVWQKVQGAPVGGTLALVWWCVCTAWALAKRKFKRKDGKNMSIELGRSYTGEEKELLRHAVLECLVARHPAALPVSGIARRIRGELDFAVETAELESALEFLKGQGWSTSQFDELGSSRWWTATAAGCLKVERGA